MLKPFPAAATFRASVESDEPRRADASALETPMPGARKSTASGDQNQINASPDVNAALANHEDVYGVEGLLPIGPTEELRDEDVRSDVEVKIRYRKTARRAGQR